MKTFPPKKVRGVLTGQRKASTGQTQPGQPSVMVVQTNAEQTQPDEDSASAVSPTSETPGSGGKLGDTDIWCVQFNEAVR